MIVRDTAHSELDRAILDLRLGAQTWAAFDYHDRIDTLGAIRPLIVRHAQEWVSAALVAKRIAPRSPLAGEEWQSGPFAVLYAINRYIRTLQSLKRTGALDLPGPVRARRDGQMIAPVFPVTLYDKLLFSGISAAAWLPADYTMAAYYRQATHAPRVALVLGAGNIAAIGPLDVLYKLIADGAVCILKTNPVNEYLAPIFKKVFTPLIERNFLRVVTGGAETGAYLTAHRDIDEIHITGSAQTHDAIVFGSDKERRATPLQKPITSELGNVSPTIVVPGRWSRADLKFQAEHIVTQKMHNGGFNCIASQVLILAQSWDQGDSLLAEIEAVIERTAPRAGYYPGAAARQARAVADARGDVREFDIAGDEIVPRTIVCAHASSQHPAFSNEAFGSVLTVTRLPGGDTAAFLKNAVTFANDCLYGTLGANIIIHPKTESALGASFEDAISDLRYGSIGINAWTGVAFLLSESTWGAYPGHTLNDVQSGIGLVHNTFLFDRANKTVLRAPFFAFPRSIAHRQMTLLPKPPWFITNKRSDDIGRRLLAFEYAPSPLKVPGIFLSALQG